MESTYRLVCLDQIVEEFGFYRLLDETCVVEYRWTGDLYMGNQNYSNFYSGSRGHDNCRYMCCTRIQGWVLGKNTQVQTLSTSWLSARYKTPQINSIQPDVQMKNIGKLPINNWIDQTIQTSSFTFYRMEKSTKEDEVHLHSNSSGVTSHKIKTLEGVLLCYLSTQSIWTKWLYMDKMDEE